MEHGRKSARSLKGKATGPMIRSMDTVQIFNDHYAAISTDTDYSAPTRKLTAPDDCCYVSENGCVSDVGHPASNSDGPRSDTGMVLATWCADFPLARLFHQSLATGVVPHQWKTAVIKPIPKIAAPTQPSDYRPISITPVLSRSLERIVVRQFIYPALLKPCLLYTSPSPRD